MAGILLVALVIPLLLLGGEIVTNYRHVPRTFHLVDMLVAVGVVGGALAAFGGWGAIVIASASVSWLAVACSRTRFARWGCVIAGTWLTMSLAVLLMAIPPARAAAMKMSSAGMLKQIALAMHNYHDTHGTFPPAYLADENGVPQHSWRVLLLPFVEESALYQQYRFDEPWNGPNNLKLLPQMPRCYAAPSASSSKWTAEYRTPYVAILDPDGAMPGDAARRLSEFSQDEAANTVLVVESPGEPPLWMEASDLETEEAIRLYAEHYPGTFGGHRIAGVVRDIDAGWYVTTVDGYVNWIDWGTLADTWRGLIRRQAVAEQSEDSVVQPSDAGRLLYRDRMAGLAVFCLFFALTLASGWRASARSAGDAGSLLRTSDEEPAGAEAVE